MEELFEEKNCLKNGFGESPDGLKVTVENALSNQYGCCAVSESETAASLEAAKLLETAAVHSPFVLWAVSMAAWEAWQLSDHIFYNLGSRPVPPSKRKLSLVAVGLLERGCVGPRAVEEIGLARGAVGLVARWGRDAE